MLKAQKIFLCVAGTCSLVACASASRADESVVQVIRTSPIVEETRVVDTANPVTTTTTTTTVKKEIVADPECQAQSSKELSLPVVAWFR